MRTVAVEREPKRRLIQDIVLLVALNVLVRSVFLAFVHPHQQFDFQWYYTHAKDMAEGNGYNAFGRATAYWPIGYPFFLSVLFRVFGASAAAGLVANAVLSLGIVLLVYASTMEVLGSRKLGRIAALAYTCLPSQIEWNAVLGSEELFTFLALLSVLLYAYFVKQEEADSPNPYKASLWLTGSGLCMGVACDVRPIPLLFVVFLLFYERFVRKVDWTIALRRCGLFTLFLMLGILPVLVRNEVALHHFVLISTNGGVNLWQGTMADGSYYWSWNPRVNPLLAAGNDQITENAIGVHTWFVHTLHHPISTIVHGFAKLFFLYWVDWNVVSVTFAAISPAWSPTAIHAVMWFDTIVYWLWMSIAIVGIKVWFRQRESKTLGFIPLLYAMYSTVVFFFFPAWDRFRYPIMPVFSIFFSIGFTRFFITRANRSNESPKSANVSPGDILTR